MNQRVHGLKALRHIALEHCANTHPDLAALARELGRVVHRQSTALGNELADLRLRERGFERWLLHKRRNLSVLVMAWPANYTTPVHDHSGLWGLEMVLYGALEVQSYTRDRFGELLPQGTDWLGPGDAGWFDANEEGYVHRCRNLSRQEVALSLHVYGGNLAKYSSYAQVEPSGSWEAMPQSSVLAGQLIP